MGNEVSIKKGKTLLDLYAVESDAIVGGFGRVFRVLHTGWKVDLAMKQPKIELFQNEKQKEVFIRECDNWIRLGLHPNIVSCYYVREIDGIPSIFAEWMEGGSLRKYIDTKALYRGEPAEVIERILDFSIQFARGLHYAHSKGLIHRDVKPDNLLLTNAVNKEGACRISTAKVADFGVSNARAIVAGMDQKIHRSGNYVMAAKGEPFSVFYCSPEQIKNKKLTHRTDIWSWAASVLEMFTGDNPWMCGSIIGKCCETYFKMAIIPIPEAMKALLRRCFSQNEADRPHDFGVIEAELLKIYQSETGIDYPRPEPKAASHTAGSLNNRALSYLDLGQDEEAEKCWMEAMMINPNHAESLYNTNVFLWKNALINDSTVIRNLSTNIIEADYYLAKFHITRGDAEKATMCLNNVKEKNGLLDISAMLSAVQKMIEQEKDGKCILKIDRNQRSKSACFSPDGRILSGDSRIRLWEHNGPIIKEYFGYQNGITALCFNLDGSQFLSGGENNTIKLWDTDSGSIIYSFEGHTERVSSLCFSPDGKLALSGSDDCTLKLWDTNSGSCVFTFTGHTKKINSVDFNQNGYEIISGSDDGTVRLWNVNTRNCIRTVSYHYRITSVCFSPDGKLALSHDYNDIELWAVETGKPVRLLMGHNAEIISACFSRDGSKALSGSSDYTMKLWDVQTGQCIRTFELRTGFERFSFSLPYSVCFSPDGRKAFTSGSYSALWQIPEAGEIEMCLSRIASIDTVINNEELNHTLVIEINALIAQKKIQEALNRLEKLRDIRQYGNISDYYAIIKLLSQYCKSGKTIITQHTRCYALKGKTFEKRPFCFDTDGMGIYSINSDSKTVGINLEGELFTFEFTENTDCYTPLCFSPVNDFILYRGNGELKVLDLAKGEWLNPIREKINLHQVACFSPDGNKMLIAHPGNTLKLWDIATNTCIQSFKLHQTFLSSEVRSACFSPDGAQIMSSHTDYSTLRLWDINSGECIAVLGNHYCESMCFSPDGRIAVTAFCGQAEIWDMTLYGCTGVIRNYRELGRFNSYDSVCFSYDGNKILWSSGDYTVSLWDIETKTCIHTFSNFTGRITSVSFGGGNSRIGAISENEIIVYDLEFDLTFPGWHDWDEGARPYLNIFLALHPQWTEGDFNNILIPDLQNRGYGWLRPEGVRVKLGEMSVGLKKE